MASKRGDPFNFATRPNFAPTKIHATTLFATIEKKAVKSWNLRALPHIASLHGFEVLPTLEMAYQVLWLPRLQALLNDIDFADLY